MNFETIVDPNSHYRKLVPDSFGACIQACGIIPHWVKDAARFDDNDIEADVIAKYQYGADPVPGFTLRRSDGALTYPDDPIKHPLIKIVIDNGLVFYQYPNAWIAFQMGDKPATVYKLD